MSVARVFLPAFTPEETYKTSLRGLYQMDVLSKHRGKLEELTSVSSGTSFFLHQTRKEAFLKQHIMQIQ